MRERLDINKTGVSKQTVAWNYYPRQCGNPRCRDKNCILAQNDIEVNYHPLMYKTRLCGFKKSECTLKFCFHAHDLGDIRDLVKLYYSENDSDALHPLSAQPSSNSASSSVKDEDLSKTDNSTTSIALSLSVPTEPKRILLSAYNVNTYKTKLCPKAECFWLQCEMYHNQLERRRDLRSYRYTSELCPNAFKEGKWLDPSNCPQGAKCKLCHTKNEYYYHPDIFKTKVCPRGSCRYGVYCPDIHKEDQYVTESNASEWQEKLQEKCEQTEEMLATLQVIAEYWHCPLCSELMTEPTETGVVLCCKYMACKKCIENMNECILCKKRQPHAVLLTDYHTILNCCLLFSLMGDVVLLCSDSSDTSDTSARALEFD